ncbi:coenzyme F420-0:L-glutamate ligase, partial [Candidatus Bathyarchaeota archaeon]|nr:coenzyme F420-0:L-glutamate ligase [Candidatus Bathyarchaeota archaeon]
DYIKDIIEAIENIVEDEDFVTVSEKAVSSSLGNLVDEKNVEPSRLARFIAKYWMRIVWPYILGPLCRLRQKTTEFLRSYPVEEGSLHKQVALMHNGFLQALMHGSEGAIDGSNLPQSYVCLPLENAQEIAHELRERIETELGKRVTVAIVDTDKTYSSKGFHFTPRPKPIKGIHSLGGVIAYVAGRSLKLKKRATPLAISGPQITTEEALEIARIANRTRGTGAGRTVWDMAKTFNVNLTDVTWKMLDSVKHRPIVIIRPKTQMTQ